MKYLPRLLKEAGKLWYQKGAGGMSASVSYYMLFALVPLLLLMVIFSSIFYGRTFVVDTLNAWGSTLGDDVLLLLHDAVINLEVLSYGYSVPILGILFFSWALIVMLNTFTTGLHTIWGIEHAGFKGWMYRSLRSILFVGVFEVYLFVLIGMSFFATKIIESTGSFGVVFIEPLFFLLMTTILFSLAYKILPRRSFSNVARIQGAFIASVLLLSAKTFVSLYLAQALVPSLFGAAGLVLVILVWVYVSVAIIYYGAAFVYVLSKKK